MGGHGYDIIVHGWAWVGMGAHMSCYGWAWVGIGHVCVGMGGHGCNLKGKCGALLAMFLVLFVRGGRN